MKTNLNTLPNFLFTQGDIYEGAEQPILVSYYNGNIELVQNGQSILIDTPVLKDLFKEITGHLPEALNHLKNR